MIFIALLSDRIQVKSEAVNIVGFCCWLLWCFIFEWNVGIKKGLGKNLSPCFIWWRYRGSNLEPRGYESRALTGLSYIAA